MTELLELLLMPFTFGFMQKALIISLLVSIPMAMLSCFLVLKGWSLMGDAISHSILPGVVLAYIINIPLAAGAFAAGMFCALATGFLKHNSRIKEDTVMGVVFSGMFALGLVLYVKVETDVHLDHILFGDMLGVTWPNVLESASIALLAIFFILIKRKDLLVHCFDSQHARAIGLSVNLLHYGLLAVLSLTIVGALKAVGIILAIAMLVSPGAIAFLLSRSFEKMMLYSIAIAMSAAFLGVYLSFYIDSAPAPTIVLIMSLEFIAVFILTTRRIKAVRLTAEQSIGKIT